MVDWTDEENDLIVADYFAMFRMVLAGTTPNKSQHRRALLSKIQTINDRNEKSIERKHMNISGVLMGAGEIWLPGYAPNANYQKSLEDAVARWLSAKGGIWPRAGFAERAPGRLFCRKDRARYPAAHAQRAAASRPEEIVWNSGTI